MFHVHRTAHNHKKIVHFVYLNPQRKEKNSKPVTGFKPYSANVENMVSS